MTLLGWKDEMCVGIRELDEQHKELVMLLNQFHQGILDKKACSSLSLVFDQLLDYAATHFKAEEALFDQYQYPDAVFHKAEHRGFVHDVQIKRSQFEAGDCVAVDLFRFVQDWITNHILAVDHSYKTFFRECGLE